MTSQTAEDDVAAIGTIAPGRGKLYAYDVPSMEPGVYDIKVQQTIAATGHQDEKLDTVQRVQVKTVSPYNPLPSALVHSFYPPRLKTVAANTLPHIVLKGALPWERPVLNLPQNHQTGSGPTPTPWLALLVFTAEELAIPEGDVLTLGGVQAKPSATMAISLPVKALNGHAATYGMAKGFPVDEAASDSDVGVNTANFIFVKQPVFREYFVTQEKGVEGVDASPSLQRYPYLAHVTDTGKPDDTGYSTIKVSTLLGHRIRPWSTPAPPARAAEGGGAEQSQQPAEPIEVYAHVVSLEHVRLIVDHVKTGGNADAVVPIISLFSWTYKWDVHEPTGGSSELFEELSNNVRPLVVRLPDPVQAHKPTEAEIWMRSRIDAGYTVVRHRDIAGEASMAIFRGPLMPKPRSAQESGRGKVPVIRPSMHGTDLQIIDVQTKMLDVSYSVAWDLGRSLAGRDAKFSQAVSLLRRELMRHAMLQAHAAGQPEMLNGGDALMESALTGLNSLFEATLEKTLEGLPEKGSIRWLQKSSTVTTGVSSVIMTEAKLRRHLKFQTRQWVDGMVSQLAHVQDINTGQQKIEVPALAQVITWILQNLLSLRQVPALYMFPDPTAITAESMSMFAVDDIWVDALVDGALSVSNTVGGSDDAVRNEIRVAINKYILLVSPDRAQISASGIVIKSQLVESFPDLSITTADSTTVNPLVLHQASHGDLTVCFFARNKDQRLDDFKAEIKLPSHQQRFAVESIKADQLEFDCELRPFLGLPDGSNSETVTSVMKVYKRGDPDCLWNWDTGMLSPHFVAEITDNDGAKWTGPGTYKKLSPDSKSIYLAIELADRDHRVLIPYKVQSDVQRQLFKHMDLPEGDDDDDQISPRDPAELHDPDTKVRPLPPPGTGHTGRSWYTKQVFSLLYPGDSIPARSRTAATQLVFAIKPILTGSNNLRAVSLEITIPMGDGTSDLLDSEAAIPRIKALNPGWPWIAAIFAKSDRELVIRLEPRVGGAEVVGTDVGTGRLPLPGSDASFVLMGATVNGVVGNDVLIRSHEVYIAADGSNREVVEDSWIVAKED